LLATCFAINPDLARMRESDDPYGEWIAIASVGRVNPRGVGPAASLTSSLAIVRSSGAGSADVGK